MRAFYLAFILVVIYTSSCEAAPQRVPQATTIVSAFKQALSSVEDESVEETTTQVG
jgi:outer membrane lipoprotein-sorting protein